MRRVDLEWHAHLDQMELRPDPLAYAPAEGVRLDGIDRRLNGIDRRLNEHGRKLDKLIAQMWVLLALMGVALILAFAILGLVLVR